MDGSGIIAGWPTQGCGRLGGESLSDNASKTDTPIPTMIGRFSFFGCPAKTKSKTHDSDYHVTTTPRKAKAMHKISEM